MLDEFNLKGGGLLSLTQAGTEESSSAEFRDSGAPGLVRLKVNTLVFLSSTNSVKDGVEQIHEHSQLLGIS